MFPSVSRALSSFVPHTATTQQPQTPQLSLNNNSEDKMRLAHALKNGNPEATALINTAAASPEGRSSIDDFLNDNSVKRKVMKGVMSGDLNDAGILKILKEAKVDLSFGCSKDFGDSKQIWDNNFHKMKSILVQHPELLEVALKFVTNSEGTLLLDEAQQRALSDSLFPSSKAFNFEMLGVRTKTETETETTPTPIAADTQEALVVCLNQFGDEVKKEVALKLIKNGTAFDNAELNKLVLPLLKDLGDELASLSDAEKVKLVESFINDTDLNALDNEGFKTFVLPLLPQLGGIDGAKKVALATALSADAANFADKNFQSFVANVITGLADADLDANTELLKTVVTNFGTLAKGDIDSGVKEALNTALTAKKFDVVTDEAALTSFRNVLAVETAAATPAETTVTPATTAVTPEITAAVTTAAVTTAVTPEIAAVIAATAAATAAATQKQSGITLTKTQIAVGLVAAFALGAAISRADYNSAKALVGYLGTFTSVAANSMGL